MGEMRRSEDFWSCIGGIAAAERDSKVQTRSEIQVEVQNEDRESFQWELANFPFGLR